ncbi:hypothetical protein DL96DRAFT_1711775 [Flagelloscypha sp. PMI_526]|nr:hypothetical protein DL96DRAFT_1711775 [Flagelloscypha sp. PMI_526]
MGETIPADVCMSEWSSKSCFIASAPTKTAITYLRRDFSTHCVLSWPSRRSYSRHFRCEHIVPPPCRLSRQWMRCKLSFKFQPHAVPVELVQDSLILNQKVLQRVPHSNDLLPIYLLPLIPHWGEWTSPVAKLPFPSPALGVSSHRPPAAEMSAAGLAVVFSAYV